MPPVNNDAQGSFSPEDIAAKKHRGAVGGMWEELGRFQFQFLVQAGLKPHHHFLDIGCGSLRGGIHFIKYLEKGHYCGIDVDSSLLKGGIAELEEASLSDRAPNLIASGRFEVGRFGRQFDFGLAFSLFTHLPMNHIMRCMVELRGVLQPDGRFFATYFEAPCNVEMAGIRHTPGDVLTHFDSDPYHYSRNEVQWMAEHCGLACEFIPEFHHPRAQQMCELRRSA